MIVEVNYRSHLLRSASVGVHYCMVFFACTGEYISALHDSPDSLCQAWNDMDRMVKLGRKVFLVALSNGNILAAEWAIHHPHDVAGIWIGGWGFACIFDTRLRHHIGVPSAKHAPFSQSLTLA